MPDPLARIRELCDQATPGPWHTGAIHADQVWSSRGMERVAKMGYGDVSNAAFIAAARSLLPALLDVARKAQALNRHMIEGADYRPDEAEHLWPLNDALIVLEREAAAIPDGDA